jgi:hypothetical protein
VAYLPVTGPDGVVKVDEDQLTKEERSTVGSHRSALGAVLSNQEGAADKIAKFQGVVIAGVPLVTDLSRIEDLAAEGRLDVDEFYSPESD